MKKRFWNLLVPLISVASAFGLQPNPSVVEEGVNTVTGDFEMNYRCLSIGEWHLNLTYREGKWEAAPVDLLSEVKQTVFADPLYPLRLSTTREGLTEILLLNPQETLPVGQLIIEHTKKGIHLSSHQGDWVHLTRSDRLIKSLANSKHPSISFTYDAGKIATIRQGNRLKEIVWREGRVAEIWETTDQRRCQVQFHYGKRETEILFASGKKIINHFDAAGQLLERTLKIGNKEVRRECLRWEKGAIKSAWIVGNQGEILTCTTFRYDAAGHKIEKTEWGNLTGACTKPILLDASSHPKTNGVEHYTRHWKYAGDLLIEEWEDNGHKACYTYAPSTVRLTQKETERGAESYEYDTLGRLIAVKQSKGGRSTYHYGNQPYQVEPEEIRQSGITTTRFYDPSGRLIQEAVTNPWGDPVSHKALGYDAEGRPTTILTVSQTATHLEQITYNQLGEVVKRDVDDHAEAYCYDRLGQLIATRNQWGHLTRHTYDPLGRLTQTVYPEVATVDKGVLQPTVQLFYDSLDRISQMIDPAGDTTQFRYTSRGDLIAVLYADGTQETFIYPLEGQLDNNNSPNLPRLEGPSPLPYSETCTLNSRGQRVMLTTAVDQQGVAIEILHDALGRMERLTKRDPEDNLLQEVEYGYDANGNLANEVHRRTDTDTYTISRRYGPNRRLIAEVDSNGQSTFYRYTAKGEIAEVVQPDGRSLNYTWDAAGHLSTLSASDQSFAYHYSYDEKGRVTAVIDAITGQKTIRRYDEFGNVSAEQLANGLTLSRSVDLYGRTTLLTLPDQSAIAYDWNLFSLRKITRLSQTKEPLYSYTQTDTDHMGRPKAAELVGNLGTLHYSYAPFSITSPHFSQTEKASTHLATSDAKGKWTRKTTFDLMGRLASEEGVKTETYSYDQLGNRNQETAPCTYDAKNQLLQQGNHHFRYDAAGNCIQSDETHYAYDPLGRLVSVTLPNGECITYTYDAFHRRISQTHQGQTELFLYDGDHDIGSCSRSGNPLTLRILEQGERSVALELNGQLFVPIHDLMGSIACLVDPKTKQVAETYRYSAFGETTSYTHQPLPYNPWRFAAKRTDHHTGLIHFGRRDYAPAQGRWMTLDPLGFCDGPNRYLFVNNQPTELTDLFGHFAIRPYWQATTQWASHMFALIQNTTFYHNCIDQIEDLGEKFLEESFLTLMGYYQLGNETGVFGSGEISDRVRVTFINGILTLPDMFERTVAELSRCHGDINVHYVYRGTGGWSDDMIRSVLARWGFESPEAEMLVLQWRTLIAEMGGVNGGGVIYHYAHSLGGSLSEQAYLQLTPEEQKMIHIFTFGSPTLLQKKNEHDKFTNYVSVRDGVCYLDPITYVRAWIHRCHEVIFVGDSKGPPIVDHLFFNVTYRSIWLTLGKQFREKYLT